MPQLEHIESIEKRLWSAADTLRLNSSYASNEYFLPVMGLVFLRHAYSRYLDVKDAIKVFLFRRKMSSLDEQTRYNSNELTNERAVVKNAAVVVRNLARQTTA
jgi:hypothetical protein